MNITLEILPGPLAICRLEADAAVPPWAHGSSAGDRFVSLARTPTELSIVCDERRVPADVRAERDWRALRVAGPIDFAVVGLIAGITAALAAARVSVFVVSTYETDYVLVRATDLARAVDALRTAGYIVNDA